MEVFSRGGIQLHTMKVQGQAYWSPDAQQRFLKWNYFLYICDGATYAAGLAFVSQESVLPSMIRELGGADWLIGLSPALLMIGTMATPLLFVHKIESLSSYRDYVFRFSLLQRAVPLFSALVLLFAWPLFPSSSVLLAGLTPLFMGLFGGTLSPAFWSLYGKLLPEKRRSSNTAWRNGLGLLVGVFAGGAITAVLSRYPGRVGYGLLFLAMFVCVSLSGLFFYKLRELPDRPRTSVIKRGFGDVLREAPSVLRKYSAFRRFLWIRSLGQAHFLVIPFLALHFRETMSLPQSFLGQIVQAQMLGGLAGNLIAGLWGDRSGARKPLCLARILALSLCAMASWISHPSLALLAFFLIGVFININNISEYMFLLEIAPPEKLPTFVALQSLLFLPVTLFFGLASKWLYQITGDVSWPSLAGGVFLLLSLYLLARFVPARAPVETA